MAEYTEDVRIRLQEAEKSMIRQEAERLQMTVSAYMRYAAVAMIGRSSEPSKPVVATGWEQSADGTWWDTGNTYHRSLYAET